jgi:hypothetical protein
MEPLKVSATRLINRVRGERGVLMQGAAGGKIGIMQGGSETHLGDITSPATNVGCCCR